MNDSLRKWVYLLILSVIWGTSYILIKKALVGFTPLQLGSVRLVMSGIFLLSVGMPSLRKITKKEWGWVALSGFLGTFFPAYFFAFAETEIDSSIASVLNSLVPLFTIIIGFLAFGIRVRKSQVTGVIIGLMGAVFLVLVGAELNPGQNYWYAGFVILATLFYACNANIIKGKLSNVSPMGIAAGNFTVILIPSILGLIFSGAFNTEVTTSPEFWPSMGYVLLLSFFGTAIAKVLFNKLIHISSPVFGVSVTYLIPLVGIIWGLLDGEKFTLRQFMAAGVILVGVYLVNAYKNKKARG